MTSFLNYYSISYSIIDALFISVKLSLTAVVVLGTIFILNSSFSFKSYLNIGMYIPYLFNSIVQFEGLCSHTIFISAIVFS